MVRHIRHNESAAENARQEWEDQDAMDLLELDDQNCSNVLKGVVCSCDPYWWATEGACVSCKNITKLRCNGCFTRPFYCSKPCQVKGWEEGHKAVCGFWKEIKVADKTFYEVKKKIPAGTNLFRKAPLYIQPDRIRVWQFRNCPAAMEYADQGIVINPLITCLSCAGFCAPIEPITITNLGLKYKYRRCPACKWPVCDTAKCALKHKERPECQIFASNGFTYEDTIDRMEPFGLIGMIRGVSLKRLQPKKWDQLMQLEAFVPLGQQEESDAKACKDIYTFMRQSLKIDWLTPSEWKKFLHIQGQNRFRCNHRYSWNTRFATIIYEGPRGTILPHNCFPNTYISVNKLNFIGTVTAHVNMRKGDVLTANLDPEYPASVKPMYARNSFLSSHGFPLCGQSGIDCPWCLDARTEGGSMLSALKCNKCDTGHLMPKEVLDNMWIYGCNTEGCAGISDHVVAQNLETELFRDFLKLGGDIPKIHDWIQKVQQEMLHPLHSICIFARSSLARFTTGLLMRSVINSLQHVKRAKEVYLPYFKYMLKWMDTFTPGRHYDKADFLFFDTLLTLGSYTIELDENTKTLEEVDEAVGELIKQLGWCWEIFEEDPMGNLFDKNTHQKFQDKMVRQFFTTAERLYKGVFKPFKTSDSGIGWIRKSHFDYSTSSTSNAKPDTTNDKKQEIPDTPNNTTGAGDSNSSEGEFKNIRTLAMHKESKTWMGMSFLGDHLAPPTEAESLEARVYSITQGAADLNLLD